MKFLCVFHSTALTTAIKKRDIEIVRLLFSHPKTDVNEVFVLKTFFNIILKYFIFNII